MNRREFLKHSLAAGALGGLAGWSLSPRSAQARSKISADLQKTLVAVRGKDADAMVRKAFEKLGGAKRFVQSGDRVVVKPNASFANAPTWGNNTNPAVLAALCKLFREAGAREVLVVDYPLMRGAEALKINGTEAACKDLKGVSIRVLSSENQFRRLTVKAGVALKEVAVARDVLDADLVINLPVAKAHDAVAVSCGLKNLMGVIWDRAAFHTQMDIHQAIADLVRVVRPDLTLVDMTRVMTSNGPKGPGEVDTPEQIALAIDPVAADAYALTQIKFNGQEITPAQLRYLSLAAEAGLGKADLSGLKILKEDA